MDETAQILADPTALRGQAVSADPYGWQGRVVYRIDESEHALVMQDIQRRSTIYRRR